MVGREEGGTEKVCKERREGKVWSGCKKIHTYIHTQMHLKIDFKDGLGVGRDGNRKHQVGG